MIKIAVIHGPNLNLLGSREPALYGNFSLDELNAWLQEKFKSSCRLTFFQTNSEEELLSAIHKLKDEKVEGLVLNAAAFTHTSVALRDALLAVQLPFVEVHLSNVYKRESFRHRSFLSDIAVGVVSGLGKTSYAAGIEYFLQNYNSISQEKNFNV